MLQICHRIAFALGVAGFILTGCTGHSSKEPPEDPSKFELRASVSNGTYQYDGNAIFNALKGNTGTKRGVISGPPDSIFEVIAVLKEQVIKKTVGVGPIRITVTDGREPRVFIHLVGGNRYIDFFGRDIGKLASCAGKCTHHIAGKAKIALENQTLEKSPDERDDSLTPPPLTGGLGPGVPRNCVLTRIELRDPHDSSSPIKLSIEGVLRVVAYGLRYVTRGGKIDTVLCEGYYNNANKDCDTYKSKRSPFFELTSFPKKHEISFFKGAQNPPTYLLGVEGDTGKYKTLLLGLTDHDNETTRFDAVSGSLSLGIEPRAVPLVTFAGANAVSTKKNPGPERHLDAVTFAVALLPENLSRFMVEITHRSNTTEKSGPVSLSGVAALCEEPPADYLFSSL